MSTITAMHYQSVEAFLSFVKEGMSATRYEQLPAELGVNEIWFGRYMAVPQSMKMAVLVKLADVLNTHPYILLRDYGCGASALTAHDALSLLTDYQTSK